MNKIARWGIGLVCGGAVLFALVGLLMFYSGEVNNKNTLILPTFSMVCLLIGGVMTIWDLAEKKALSFMASFFPAALILFFCSRKFNPLLDDPDIAVKVQFAGLVMGIFIPMIVLAWFGLRWNKRSVAKREEQERRQAEVDRAYLETIQKTVIVDSSHTATSQPKKSSMVGRAVVGDLLFGTTGAIIGAATAKHTVKEKHATTFLVYFTNGTTRAITVDNNSKEYRMYMSKLSAD